MVSRYGAVLLMNFTRDLTYVYERSRSTSTIGPPQFVQVKGKEFILEALRRSYGMVGSLAEQFPAIVWIGDSMRDWIAYLEKKYVESGQIFGPPVNLDVDDAKKLADDSNKWLNAVFEFYLTNRGTVLIKEENIDQIFPDALTVKLDEVGRKDLVDGVDSILVLLPTPASMILLRVAENIVRRYYTKVTGKKAVTGRWQDLLNELEANPKVKKPFISYLDYIRDIRNQAQHPDKRFTQIESEQILMHVKGLLEQVDS